MTTRKAVEKAVEFLSRKTDREWGGNVFAAKRLVEYGPLTTDVAKRCDIPVYQAYRHLMKLLDAGVVFKHLSYKGCIARWYKPRQT